MGENGEQAHQSAAAVVAAKAVETFPFNLRREGVGQPASGGLHRVDVRIEQQGGAVGELRPSDTPKIVVVAHWGQALLLELFFQEIGHGLFIAAHAWNGDEAFQKFGGVGVGHHKWVWGCK